MANDIDKTSPHYKGDFGSIYEVNKKFPTGGVAGDFVVIEGWAHYWNADRATWCVNAQRDSYWDELITNIIEKFKLVRGATYLGVASLDTVPTKVIGAKMYYFATVAGTYKNFGDLVVPQGISVLYSENGSSWVNTTLLEVAQELGVSTKKAVSQKALNDALKLKADQSSVNEALAKKADKAEMNRLLATKANTADVDTKFTEEKKRVDGELDKKFDKQSVVQESGEAEDKVMSQKAVSDKLSDLSKTLRVFDKVYLSANSSIKAYDVLPIGSTYEFTNKGQFPVSISLRKGEDDVVQEIKYGLSVGDTVTAKINETYEFIFIYSSKTPNVHIKQKDTIVKAVAELENTTSTLQSKTADLYEKDNLKKSILHSQIMANRNSSLIEWEPGHIDQEGNDSDYDKEHRYRSNFLYLKAGDTIRCADSKVDFYLFKYNKDFSFESVSESALKEIVIEDNCIARILAVCYDVSSTFLSKVSVSTKGVVLSVSTENVDSHLAKNVFDKFDFGWEHGHIDVNGLNSFYDAKYRMRSKFLYVKKGDILALIRNSKERYIIYYYSEKKLLVKATDWLISNTKIEENGFIRILLAYTDNADFSTDEKLSDSMQYYTFGEFDNWKNASWEMGGIVKTDGSNYDSSSSCRNSRILHLKAGTIVIPYVFGRYLIAYYDNDGNFLRREPVADNGGQHNDGYYSQNAFEFKEDVNVRFVLFWMNAAKFDKNEGYENILSNDDTAESLSRKFRIIPPSYKMPYYIKKVIDDKNKEIAALGNIFKATFITDPHEYYYHEIAARYCAELTSNVLLNGGDLLSYPQNGVDSAIDTVSRHMQALVGCSVPVIMTRGNHEASMDTILTDGNDPHYENAYNRQIYYAQVQRPLMNSAFKYNIGYEDSGYFFYDDKINKVRIICINNFVAGSYHRIEQHQRYWLIEQALDLSSKGEDEKNWAVIAVGHSPILDKIDYDEPYATNEDRWISDVFKACYNKTNVIISDPDTELGEDYVTYRNEHKWDKYNEWTSLVHDFTGIKYQFACYLCGHSHYDKISKDKDFPHINTTCAHPLENVDKYRRVFDTELEYAFDVLCLDKANRKIILKRIGVGTDRNTSY